MKILIIDDTDYKIESLVSLLNSCGFTSNLRVAKSFQTSIPALKEFKPDIVLLDMSLPTSEREDGALEGRPRIYGGKDVLAEMVFEEMTAKVIIVTQFDHFGEPPNSTPLDVLLKELQRDFPHLYVGGVFYSDVDYLWRDQLRALLKKCFIKKI